MYLTEIKQLDDKLKISMKWRGRSPSQLSPVVESKATNLIVLV